EPGPETRAGGTGAVGRVEAEVAGSELVVARPAGGTGQMLREGQDLVASGPFVGSDRLGSLPELGVAQAAGYGRGAATARGTAGTADDLHLGDTLRQAEGRLQRVGEAALDAGPLDQPVDHYLDRVVLVPGQLDLLAVRQLHDLPVDAGA